MPLLTRKSLILAKVETTEGTDALPTQANDAILVSEPNFEIDPNILERNNTKATLSPDSVVVGRKLASFSATVELKGNGSQNSGNVNDRPQIGTLLRGCGYVESGISSGNTNQISDIVSHADNSSSAPKVSWTKSGSPSLTLPVVYTLEVTTGGASGTAQVAVSSSNSEDTDVAATAVTSGSTALALGTKGGTITPTWSGSLVVGTKYQVLVVPSGIKYAPTSEDTQQDSLTIYYYKDGTLYKILGARGTFTINAEAGNYGTVEFTYTGQYVAVTDVALPTAPVYETTLPGQVEQAGLVLDLAEECQLVAGTYTFDQANEITPRPDICGTDGYRGVRITARTPVGTLDPEATLEADFDFWQKMSSGKTMFYSVKQGTQAGNIFILEAPRIQFSNISHGDRDGILVYESDLRFTVNNGDDEVKFYFC